MRGRRRASSDGSTPSTHPPTHPFTTHPPTHPNRPPQSGQGPQAWIERAAPALAASYVLARAAPKAFVMASSGALRASLLLLPLPWLACLLTSARDATGQPSTSPPSIH